MATSTKSKRTQDGERIIQIPSIAEATLIVTLEGITPLISHRLSDEVRAKLEKAQSEDKEKGPLPPRDPQAEYEASIHRTLDGKCGFPASSVRKALVNAGFRFAGEQGTVLRGVIFIPGDVLPLRPGEPRMRSDMRRLKNGVPDPVYRAEFWPWELDVEVTFFSNYISMNELLRLFHLAGQSVGIGDWRPELKNGWAGRFRVKDARQVVTGEME